MHTGDLAAMDADGYINITGRLKDMVIRGGENIAPREIEDFPMTASGKVRKVDMRKAAIDMLGLTGIAASRYA